jgi:predicted PurR-regulated permease PerM
MKTLLSIFIFFLSLSMLLYYGESIWNTVTSAQSSKVSNALNRLAEISENTIYALIIVQVSAAMISFALAIPFFYFLGYGNVLLFSSLIGFAMLIPLIGAQIMILSLRSLWSQGYRECSQCSFYRVSLRADGLISITALS